MMKLWTTLTLLCTAGVALVASGQRFDPRQKWESNEVNCIQISNPAPGATYRPGYFVRMYFGTQMCGGASAAAPWTIHLYNNPQLSSGHVTYDYHEVIGSNINAYNTQYLWTIPPDYVQKTKGVQENREYFVRIETTSNDGRRLVGNAGPFAIVP